ncbi:MAG: Lsr2 family protein [Rhodococcus sp. (in: high G+C Gram-positive bacteria)]
MAKQVVVQLVDDIDQTPLDDTGEHITFAVDGIRYEIDLSADNAAEFRRTVGYYVKYAAKVSSTAKSERGGAKPIGRRSAEQTKAVREWAIDAGYNLSARGRIPSEVQRAYDAAH